MVYTVRYCNYLIESNGITVKYLTQPVDSAVSYSICFYVSQYCNIILNSVNKYNQSVHIVFIRIII